MSKNYWNKLNYRQKNSKIERFEFIMSKITNMANGVSDADTDFESKINALEDRVAVLEAMVEDEDENEEEEESFGNVSVTVKDEEGNPLQGVEIIVADGATGDEYEGTTGSAGGCNINNVPLGDYELLGFKEGYNQYYGNITVVAGANDAEVVMVKK